MPKKGRPVKSDSEGTPDQIAKRNYQRKYNSEIKQGIADLEQAEKDCLKELESIRKDRNKLINMLSDANNQAESILKEKTKK